MPIKVFENSVIHEKCRTKEEYEAHRLQLYRDHHMRHRDGEDKYITGFREVVKGSDVVEIACGVFGGLSSLALEMGCKSYTGVDFSIGDKTEMVMEEDIRCGEKHWRNKVPLIITIPEGVKNDHRANFIYGMDFLTYLKYHVNDSSVVTISTGFFDKECILMPKNQGEDYVLEGMEHLARVTPKGYPVGMHEFFCDEDPPDKYLTHGKFFKENFPKFGIKLVPICMGERDSFCLFMKE